MKHSVQILVARMTTIHTGLDIGRFVEIVPMSDALGEHSIGAEMEFFHADGRSVCGKVVDKKDDMRTGKFPTVKGLVIDTAPETDIIPQRRRSQQGGYHGTSGAQHGVKGGSPAHK